MKKLLINCIFEFFAMPSYKCRRIILSLLFVCCFWSNSIAGEVNLLFKTGAEYFDWKPWDHPAKHSTAVIDSEKYGLARYSLDFFYNHRRIFYIDYYQPINSEEESGYYIKDLNRVGVSPLTFFNDNPERPYLLRLLLTTEFFHDYKDFEAILKTKSELTYNTLEGQELTINSDSEGISNSSELRYEEITVDLLAGRYKSTIFKDNPTDDVDNTFMAALFTCTELKLGYFSATMTRPFGEEKILNESKIDVNGFLYGFRSKNRGTPGFNVDYINSYGGGYLTSYDSKRKINYIHYFLDTWYNLYFLKSRVKMMITAGIRYELIEISEDKQQLIHDEIYKFYLQTGLLF
jgi:hypothetical protein